MPIYDKPVRLLMRDMADAFHLSSGQAFTKQQAVAWFREHYPKIKPGTVAAHLIMMSTNAKSRVHFNPKPGQDDLCFQLDGGRYRLYDPNHDPPPVGSQSDGAPAEPVAEEEQETVSKASTEFAYESDLRDYLSKNLPILESGLRLYEEEGITGVEFPVGGRFIDLLAVDARGGFVVIELKVSRGYDRVVGQLLRYMAWIRKNLAEPNQTIRGMIVAREISEDLLLACSFLPNVELFEYELSLAVTRIDPQQAS